MFLSYDYLTLNHSSEIFFRLKHDYFSFIHFNHISQFKKTMSHDYPPYNHDSYKKTSSQVEFLIGRFNSVFKMLM